MSSTAELLSAIARLQEAQAECAAAIKSILDHNVDLKSHPDIRDMLQELIDGEVVYTEQQILELVAQGIGEHIEKDITTAHSGYQEMYDDIDQRLNEHTAAIEEIRARLDHEEPAKTDLEQALQDIEDKYAVVLDSLTKSFKEAEEMGNEELMKSYKESIDRTLDEKKAEIMAAYEQYSNQQP